MKLFCTIFLLTALRACSKHEVVHKKEPPATVEKTDVGDGVSRLTLTPEARKRLGIENRIIPRDKNGKRTVPVSALLYDTKGAAWVFVEPEKFQFHREQIRVLQTRENEISIESSIGDSVPVVIEGAAELSGTESGVGK